MTTEEQALRNLFAKHFATALSKVEHNRGYALDASATAQGTSFALAYRDEIMENNGRFDLDELSRIIEELSQDVAGLKQNRPPPEPEKLTPYMDEVTGQYAKNPWSEPVDLDSQMLIAKRDPKLAEHLQAVAKGVSYSYLIKQQDGREARAKIRDLRYSAREHTPQNNPWLLPPGAAARAAQSEFVRQHEQEPWLVEWYKKEATPITLNFDNLTTRSLVTRRNPVVGAIFEKAREIHSHFLREDQARLEAEVTQRQEALQQMKAQLTAVK